jgi:hypothetical protein
MKKFFFLLQRTNFLAVALAVMFLGAPSGWTQQAGKQTGADDAASEPSQRPNLSSADLIPKAVEDFTTPALTASTALGEIKSLQMELDEDTQFTREIVRVQWRPIDPIDLYVIKPVGVRNPPVILYLYNYPTENDQYHKAEFCRFLTKGGFAAVGFVPALTGERYHDRAMKEWFVSELRESLATSAHDVQMVLNYLATRGDLDMNRVGMFGDGSGASIAILTSGVDSRIKTLDLLDPWGDWPDWIAKSTLIPENERPDYLKPEWLAKVASLDPVKWLPKVQAEKVRIQFVKTLPIIPGETQQKLEAAAPANAQIVHYDDAAAFRRALADGSGYDWIKKKMEFSVVPGLSTAERTQEKGSSNPAKDSQQ